MSGINELAKELRRRDNPRVIGVCIGTVSSVTPLKVKILDGLADIEEDTYLCRTLAERTEKVSISTLGEKEITITDVLKKGDQVLCVPCGGEQSWVIVDKVVR